MNSKEEHEFYLKNFAGSYKRTSEEVVQNLVNRLIDSLYIPVEGYDDVTKTDKKRLKHFGIKNGEPINWGDLKCNEVKKLNNGSYRVIIDEAAPNECESFCDYIEKYMRSYGWECRVTTEW